MIIGYKLQYRCIKHNDYQVIECDTLRELNGYLYDMKKYLQDYKIIELHNQEFALL